LEISEKTLKIFKENEAEGRMIKSEWKFSLDKVHDVGVSLLDSLQNEIGSIEVNEERILNAFFGNKTSTFYK
jgi:hypothetical protein